MFLCFLCYKINKLPILRNFYTPKVHYRTSSTALASNYIFMHVPPWEVDLLDPGQQQKPAIYNKSFFKNMGSLFFLMVNVTTNRKFLSFRASLLSG